MEIKQFIKEALINLVEGVNEANSRYPNRFKIIGNKRHNPEQTDGDFVDFDISVVVNDALSGKIKGKIGTGIINVVSGNIASEVDHGNSLQNTHRLKFKIYVSENID